MGKRREPRIQFDVPVKVCGMDTAGHPFVQTAYAISISRSGVRLTGVGPLVRVGETVVVIYKNRKARFKVAWIGDPSQPEFGQAGLEVSGENSLIWDFALPHPGIDGYVSPHALSDHAASSPAHATTVASASGAPGKTSAKSERRSAPRYKFRGSAEIFVPDVSFPTRGLIDDISLSGVYIQTSAPLLVGSTVKLRLAVQNQVLQADAEVRTSHPGVGMGMLFTNMTAGDRLALENILSRFGGVPVRAKAAAADATSSSASTIQTAVPASWDAVGRATSDWFKSHDTLGREDFFALMRRL